jgi:DNA-binding Xre family transcriptional regulator
MSANFLIDQILAQALSQEGIRSGELLDKAGLYPSAISRIRSTGDCRFSTIQRLLDAAGFKLVIVKNDRDSELLAKGELF